MPIAITLLTVVALMSILYSLYGDYGRAVWWHAKHGDYLNLGNNRLKLPRTWWLKATDSDGTLILVNSSEGFNRASSGIRVIPIEPRGKRQSENELLEATKAGVAALNVGIDSTAIGPASLQIMNSRAATLYCIRQTMELDHEFTLQCQAVNLDYSISSSGLAKWENETDSILKDLE